MKLKHCYNIDDFRRLARKKLPAPCSIILMAEQMMKGLCGITQHLLTDIIWCPMFWLMLVILI
jgi:hypothetical protein